MNKLKPVRTRFAPSPTGFMHVGGVRNALFAWLLARHTDGKFIFRLEDTDKNREVEGSAQHIIDSLRWLGLDWDEGLEIDGPYGPYKQSDRLEIYQEWGQKLIARGRAYADPYSAAEVDKFREQAKTAKKPFLYRNFRPENPPEWDGSQPLRFKSDPKDYTWNDAVMGELSAGAEAVDDFILIKSDGYATYNFAHIIDDMLMECTHIIRSQEFVASVPKYLNLYEALEITPPVMATMPLIMGPDGKKKLSKRDNAKDILDYAREGFLPETLVNFIATLGWNDGTEQEIFSPKELVEKFSLDHINKGSARFDEQRLLWMSGQHIRQLPPEQIKEQAQNFWPAESETYSGDYKQKVLLLVQERLKYFSEIPQLTDFFFKDLPVDFELITTNKKLKKYTMEELKKWLAESRDSLAESDFTLDDLTNRLNDLLEQTDQKPAVLFSLIRIASTQAPASPGLADTLSVLGKEVALRRLDNTLSAM